MFWFPTKKEVKREFKKIDLAFKERDEKIEKLREKLENNSLKIATLEGAFSLISNKTHQNNPQSQSQSQGSLKQSHETFETKLIKRIKNNKKSLIMAEILKLMPSYSVIEIYQKIVLDKRLCSKASFYRYIDSLKSQKLTETETKVRLN